MDDNQIVGIAGIAMSLMIVVGALKEIVVTREFIRRQALSSEGVDVNSTLLGVQTDFLWWPLPPKSKR